MRLVAQIKGNLITLAKEGHFDAIVQGNNCFCTQGAGLAPQMVREFGTDTFPMERDYLRGDINKLGTIDYEYYPLNELSRKLLMPNKKTLQHGYYDKLREYNKDVQGVTIINAYTQYGFGRNHEGGTEAPIDYIALKMVMQKINHIFKGKHIGLPWIGAGLAGGDWNRIRGIITNTLVDCDVTLVEYDGSI